VVVGRLVVSVLAGSVVVCGLAIFAGAWTTAGTAAREFSEAT
jgi:hypothetical protein